MLHALVKLRGWAGAVATGAIALCSPCVHAADPLARADPESVGMSSARLARLTGALQGAVDRGQIPGSVVAVARRGRLVYFEAVGWLDPENRTPMPKDAIFSIASMTKPMTSVALMQLFEEGRVAMTDPVGVHLPVLDRLRLAANHENPAATTVPERQPSVQDLMRHTAGMLYGGRGPTPLHKLYPASSASSGRTLTASEFLDRLAAAPLAYPPGRTWDYSLATDVVGLIVEKARSGTLGQVLSKVLWQPLGMVDTSFVIPEEKRARYARWFAKDPATGQPTFVLDLTQPLRFDCGGGCAASTAGDYIRFAQMLLDRGALGDVRILGRKTVEYMTTDHLGPEVTNLITRTVPALNGYGFGLGVAVRRQDGVAGVIGSQGDYMWGGAYGTHFWVDPRERLAVVVMAHAPEWRANLRSLVSALVLQALTD